MIILITGQPGAGKSLYGLVFTKRLAEKQNREVYYHGIKDLTLPWTYLEKPEEWYNLPHGAVIVHDECQTLYRPRGIGSKVPIYESEFETHRHKGFDIVLITQHPNLLSSHVRKLVGQHFHVKRKWGTNAATVHEWSEVNTTPEKTRADSIRHEFVYPKEAFNYYKSAEIHTVKRNIPMRIYLLFTVPFILAAFGYFLYQSIFKENLGTPSSETTENNQSFPIDLPQSNPDRKFKPDLTYIEAHKPEIDNFPHTAPIYKELTKPTQAPYPAACVEFKGSCTCWTQQGTKLKTSYEVCKQIVANGYFVEWQTASFVKPQDNTTN